MIISYIQTVVEKMRTPSGTSFPDLGVGPASWRNMIADKIPLLDGWIFLNTPITNDLDLQLSGHKQRAYALQIFFMWKSRPDWTPKQHDELAIQPARMAVLDFINIAETIKDENGENLFNEIKNAKEAEFINLLDANVSGVILSIVAKPRNNISICTE